VPSKGKAKGNSWERELAVLLKEQFDLPFQRVPNSGAFLGGSNFTRRIGMDKTQERIMTGDLIVPEELKHISFECKFYKKFDYHLLYKQNKQLEDWVDQAKEGCNMDQTWFLCIKANRRDPLIVFEDLIFLESLTNLNYTSYNFKNKHIFITDLKKFISLNRDVILHKK